MTEWCAVDSHCSAISVDSYMPTGRLYRDYSCVDIQATFSVSLDKKNRKFDFDLQLFIHLSVLSIGLAWDGIALSRIN